MANSAEPAQIEVRDTAGVTRSVSSVEVAGDVEFSLVDQSGMPAEGAEITLTNEATGEVLRAVSANGVVRFTGVAPGIWTVASTVNQITFTAVTITGSTAVAGTFGGTALFGMPVPQALAVGVGGSSSDDPELSPFR
jgi:hypothetical protein